jgi:isoleucyl-tRNA synthetase
MNSMVQAVDSNLSAYRIPDAGRALQDFVDDMSNWYVRRSRERFWAKGMEQDKINAYMTLYTALVTICKAAAPMIPFITEEIYQNLVCSVDKSAPESIHLCDYPVANEAWIDTELESNMDELLKVVVMGRAARNTANIKNRQPIGKMYVKAPFALNEFFKAIIEDELNIKEVVFTDDVENFVTYSFKPQLKTVGPKFGKLLGKIRPALAGLDGSKAMAEVKETGKLSLDLGEETIQLLEEDLLIDMAQMEGYVSEADNTVTVVLDTNLTPELIEEGFVRELISKIQTMRKEAGFEVMDKICIYVAGNEKIESLMKGNQEAIQKEVMAEDTRYNTLAGYQKEWKINAETVTLAVEKLS